MLINQYFKRGSPAKRTANLVIISELTKLFTFIYMVFPPSPSRKPLIYMG